MPETPRNPRHIARPHVAELPERSRCPLPGEETDVQWRRMVEGRLYRWGPTQARVRERAIALLEEFNADAAWGSPRASHILRELLGSFGAGAQIVRPFTCDYGVNISLGEGSFINTGAVILDLCPVRIGAGVLIAPLVTLSCASHPIDPALRATRLEYGRPITIENNVWIGMGASIAGGVTIGENSVVGAGAVVLRDVPPGSVVGGVPARVLRFINSDDAAFAAALLADYRAEVGEEPLSE
ncbi:MULTISPECIES: sugar O-acetyltransferase [Actinotignum]|uniref:Sugar O-acetyltransferase n=1 Tax=Actinotignum timonense TaxID=1870995 RepID=A0ABU5GB70_9ACTO|nr:MULTISPECIES: sugar O-acetyltransferase [Actinotignum]MDE1558150.1 sugar O-acetyltransferase [Actinotignum schaalii]MDE1662816.1 sugar O-acetyltransferase [Actinotignum schaalii]MDK6372984.1 sugar O-acetyltransferase [Actinotignum timonense]MDK6419002.1 sugar O-acetyltransferase [Actinotignum timonense]MDK6589895.1 sugar O-acetyltransferase [Actinotignum timonense]